MVDHRNMVSSEVHEPKHIADSSTADAGKVITPLSGGTSELRYLTPTEVGVNNYFLEWGVLENATATAVTAATDLTLYTSTDYIDINSVTLPGAVEGSSNGITFDSTSYNIEIPATGTYRVSYWLNVESDTNNTEIGVRPRVNGSASGPVAKHDLSALGRTTNISASVLMDLTGGDTVGISLASDKTASIIVDDIMFSVSLVLEA